MPLKEIQLNIGFIQELLQTSIEDNTFEKLVQEISAEYGANPTIIRAIGNFSSPLDPKLNEVSKGFIRSYVSQAEIEDEKRKRRKELAELFNVSLSSVSAITAWTKIHADRAQKNENPNLKQKYEEPQGSTEPQNQTSNYILHTDIETNKQGEYEEPQGLIEIQNQTLNCKIHTDIETNKQCKKETNGAHIDYNNCVKNEWRKKMKEFLLERTTENERKKMKVLCLPGKEWLEVIQVYLELGFLAENIVGIEKEESVFEEIDKNKPTGCRLEKIDLLEYLKITSEKFDVISLDFLGPISPENIEIIKNIHVNDRYFLFTNFMGKRERSLTQEIIQGHDSFMRNIQGQNNSIIQISGNIIDKYNKDQGLIKNGIENPVELSNARSSSLLGIIQNFVGENRMGAYSNIYKKLLSIKNKNNGLGFEIERGAIYIISKIQEALEVAGTSKNVICLLGIRYKGLFLKSLRNFSFLVDYKKYKYISKAGKVPTPFISDFFEFSIPSNIYEQTRHSTNFLLSCIEHFGNSLYSNKSINGTSIKFIITDKNGIEVFSGLIGKGYKLILLVNGSKTLEITIGKIIQDIETYEKELLEKNLPEKLRDKINEIPRVEIRV